MDDGSGMVTMVPAWMLDPVACVGMKLGEPRVSVAALRELHHRLVEHGLRRDFSNDSTFVQEECDEFDLRDHSAAASGAGRDTSAPDFTGLAEDLEAAWNAPGVTMRARQQLVRALITDIVADVDEKGCEIILTIHWQGGQHSQLRMRKPKSGEHGRRTPEEALAVIRSMSCRWSDQDIAASLNRMGMRTGQGMTWNAQRVSTARREHGVHAYRSAEKNGEWLTMSEAAKLVGVSHHVIRRLIRERILRAEQVVPGVPNEIRASDLQSEAVAAAIARKRRPCRFNVDGQLPMFISTSEGGA